MPKLTDQPFLEELPRLLRERGLSIRGLSAQVGIQHSHLSRLLRQKDFKRTPSPDLIEAVSAALDLPEGYFPEAREAYVMARLKEDRRMLNTLYQRLTKS